MTDDAPTLPPHIEETIKALARLQAQHDQQASPLQRVVDSLTARAARPEFVSVLALLVLSWGGINLGMAWLGRAPPDPPPFFWMQGMIALSALIMTSLILTTQRREDQLTGQREQLTLELSILSEQKAAKIIALLEELRRDHPGIHDRTDAQADAMSEPADPQTVLDAIQEAHGGGNSATSISEPVDQIIR